jgi:hypothetical protein
MDAAQASPVSAWMAVSREQNDHPLVPRVARLLAELSARQQDLPQAIEAGPAHRKPSARRIA